MQGNAHLANIWGAADLLMRVQAVHRGLLYGAVLEVQQVRKAARQTSEN